MSRALVLSAVALWAAPAAALTAGEPVALPAQAFEQQAPAVAFGDGVYLVVWQSEDGPRADVHGARISAAGELLDEVPLAIATAPERQKRPRVAFAGGVFLVVWEDLRSGADYDVYGCRVRPDGTVLDREGLALAGGPRNQAQPDVAGGPDRFVVVHQHSIEKGYVAEATSVGFDGAVLRPRQPLYPEPTGGGIVFGNQVRVAHAAGLYLVSFNGGWERNLNGTAKIAAQRLSADGVPLDPLPFDVSRPAQRIFAPNVAPGPSGWLVAWQDLRERGESGFPGAASRVSAEGVVLDANPDQLTFGTGGRKTYQTTVAFDGTRWVAAFLEPVTDRREARTYWNLVLRTIGLDGDDAGEDTLVMEDGGDPSLASAGAGASLLVYTRMAQATGERMRVEARLVR